MSKFDIDAVKRRFVVAITLHLLSKSHISVRYRRESGFVVGTKDIEESTQLRKTVFRSSYLIPR
jgi:hypothetical protein